jgi:KaiC/GvpD/RAD55 family RecA-like ATPase
MFSTTIRGIEKIFKTNVYENMTILILGQAGTLKSSFACNMLSKYLENNDNKIAMYATLEQTKESLYKNIKGLGIPINERMRIADYNHTRELYKNESERADFLDLTERLILSTKEEYGDQFTCFALDSLNALYTLIETESARVRRKRVYYFFKTLRDCGLTSFIIKEIHKTPSEQSENEGFLADGVIELGVRKTPEGKKRYLEVLKMRNNEHSMRQYVIETDKAGLAILGPSVDDRGE